MGLKRLLRNLSNRRKSSAEVFSDVYKNQRWGDDFPDFFSGPGSLPENSTTYVDMVCELVTQKFDRPIRFVDLGCGDYLVGQKLRPKISGSYTGVDVVPELITHLNSQYANSDTQFLCLDLAEDVLPSGDIACIRQVLQHLSNAQISKILSKLSNYSYVLITEHMLDDIKRSNIDIVHGQNSRRRLRSAVVPSEPPFSLDNAPLYRKLPYHQKGEYLAVYLMDNTSSA